MLNLEQEWTLISRFQQHKCQKSVTKLIEINDNLIHKTAMRYEGYGIPFEDMLQQAYIGYINAINKYNPERKCKLSTFSTHHMIAELNDYAMKYSRIAKTTTTNNHRKLFFNLRKLQAQFINMNQHERYEKIAQLLDVQVEDVKEMEKRLNLHPQSYSTLEVQNDEHDNHALVLSDSRSIEEDVLSTEQQQTAKEIVDEALAKLSNKQRDVFINRYLTDTPLRLSDLSTFWGVSKQRIEQIQKETYQKVSMMVSD